MRVRGAALTHGRLRTLVAVGLVALAVPSISAEAAPGDLDTSYGSGGVVRSNFGHTAFFFSIDAYLQAGDKVLLVGWAGDNRDQTTDFATSLVRLDSAGAPDPSFGTGGQTVTPNGTAGQDGEAASASTLTPDGAKLVVASMGGSFSGTTFSSVLRRYNVSNGALDTTFGTNGKVSRAEGEAYSATSMLAQPDGKLVVVGVRVNISRSPPSYVPFMRRFTAAGALDPTFGSNGEVTLPLSRREGGPYLTRQLDGKLVVADSGSDTSNGPITLARYTADGALDNSFGAGGKAAITPDPDPAARTFLGSLTLASGGQLLLGGEGGIVRPDGGPSNPRSMVAQLTATGALDPAFGTTRTGLTFTAFEERYSLGWRWQARAQPDGQIISAGGASPGNTSIVALRRFSSDGTLDRRFGRCGTTLLPTGGTDFAVKVTSILNTGAGDSLVVGSDDRDQSAFVMRVHGGAGSPPTGPVVTPAGTTGDADITSATVHATIDPGPETSSTYVEYGTTAAYGRQTDPKSTDSTGGPRDESFFVGGLEPNTTYHYRYVAANGCGTTRSGDLTFKTAPRIPFVYVYGVSATSSTAQLDFNVTPRGLPTTYAVDYGTGPQYGASTPDGDAGSSTSAQAESVTLSALTPSTTYFYRVRARNNEGETSSTGSFRTLDPFIPPPPTTTPPPPDSGAPPAGSTGAAPAPTASVSVSTPSKQRPLRKKAIVLTASCNRRCVLTASGNISISGSKKQLALPSLTTTLPGAGKVTLSLKLSSKLRVAVSRALAARKKVTARVSVAQKGASAVQVRKITVIR